MVSRASGIPCHCIDTIRAASVYTDFPAICMAVRTAVGLKKDGIHVCTEPRALYGIMLHVLTAAYRQCGTGL